MAVAALLAAAPLTRAQIGIGLTPMREELHLGPSAQHSGTVAVSNDSPGKLRIRAELLDFYIDAEATPQFSRTLQSETSFSCRDWVTVNPVEWEQGPGTIQSVRYSVRVPASAGEQSYHCGIGFTVLPTAAEAKGIGLRMTVRAVAALYVFSGNSTSLGALKEIALERFETARESGWRAVVIIDNPGAFMVRPSGEIAVLDEHDRVIETHALSSVPVLPRRQQRLLVPLEHVVSQGRYTLRVRVDAGTGEIQEGTAAVMARLP